REAEPQLRLTRWISIKRVAGDEGNPRYERAVEQGARADTGDKAAPQVESPVRTRESQDTWRDMPLQRRDHQSASTRVLRADRLQVRIEAALPNEPRHRKLDEILCVRIETLLDDGDLIDDRGGCREPAQSKSGRHHL